jgi:hypothetical protein
MSPPLAGYRHLTLVHGNNINGTLRSCPRPSTFLCVAVSAISFMRDLSQICSCPTANHASDVRFDGALPVCASAPPFFLSNDRLFSDSLSLFCFLASSAVPRRFLVPSGGQMMTRSRNSTHTTRFHNATQNEEDVLLKRPPRSHHRQSAISRHRLCRSAESTSGRPKKTQQKIKNTRKYFFSTNATPYLFPTQHVLPFYLLRRWPRGCPFGAAVS